MRAKFALWEIDVGDGWQAVLFNGDIILMLAVIAVFYVFIRMRNRKRKKD